MKNLKNTLIAITASFFSVAAFSEIIYVGSWRVFNGPHWLVNPPVYTGQEAAALIFGGKPSEYIISTISDQVNDINYSAYLDGWGDEYTYGSGDNFAPHDFSFDLNNDGYENPDGNGNAYSAYVSDHGLSSINYAFINTEVPVPAAAWLFGSALAGLGVVRRKK